MQDKNKNKLLDKLAATSWGVRAGPPKKKHYGEPGRAHLKKKQKNFSSCSCTLFTCANTTDLLWAF